MTPESAGYRPASRVRSNSPPGQAQTLTVLSPLPEARVLPSGLQVTAQTQLTMAAQGAQQLATGPGPDFDRVVATA